MNSVINYFGGKIEAARRYGPPDPSLPIIEPFAGGAGYSLHYGANREVILVEKSPRLAGVWRWLLEEATPDCIRGIPTDVDCVDDLDYPQPVRDLVGFCYGTSCVSPRKTKSSWMKGYEGLRAEKMTFWYPARRERLANQLPLMKNWRVIEGSYEVAPDIEANWFIDPPYQSLSNIYAEKFSDFSGLAQWCKSRRGRVVVCEMEGADWLPFSVLRRGRSSRRSYDASKPRHYSEMIWSNRPPNQGELI